MYMFIHSLRRFI